MTKLGLRIRLFASIVAASAMLSVLSGTAALAQAPVCSVWLIESSRFMNVPFGSFMPDRAFVPGSDKPTSNIPTVDLPVNIGVIKCGTELILYDTGWKQQDYLKMTGSDHWAPLGEQLKLLGFNADAPRQHRPRLLTAPAAVRFRTRCLGSRAYAIRASNYPEKHIKAINLDPVAATGRWLSTCRQPCGRSRQDPEWPGRDIRRRDGDPGLADHPTGFRPTQRDRNSSAPTSTGAVRSMRLVPRGHPRLMVRTFSRPILPSSSHEQKAIKITGGYEHRIAAHEPLSYTYKYPVTKNSWVALNGGRMAEIALAPGEKSRKP
jgi:hypothetical protein